MGTNKEQGIVNTYFQDVTIKNACELLAIEQRLKLDGLVLPNNVIVNRNGVSCAEFIQCYENPQYPKTYEECARLLNTYRGCIGGYNWKLLSYFQELLICRDAYWKIAGEEMGLDKLWKPDWSTEIEIKYVIEVYHNNVRKNSQGYSNTLLAFPTEEMRNAFYENFKDLIEFCKELL